jgi:hypothetical protein
MPSTTTPDVAIDHDPSWFDVVDPAAESVDLTDDMAELALVRARGLSLNTDLIAMIAPLGLRREDRTMIRTETGRQILHEIAVLREASEDPYRPSIERIAARALIPILRTADAARLAHVAADLEVTEPNMKQFSCTHPAGEGRLWRRIDTASERWRLGRETPHPAAFDTLWAGRLITAGSADLWLLETDWAPLMQVLVDMAHPVIIVIWAQDVPEDIAAVLLHPLIVAEGLRPWLVRRDEDGPLWPVWQDESIASALSASQ